MRFSIFFLFIFLNSTVFANPYWDPLKVPKDSAYKSNQVSLIQVSELKTVKETGAIDVLRVQVDWQEQGDAFTVSKAIIEPSGTKALLARSSIKPKWGSYLGVLKNSNNTILYYDSVGTGQEYRKLTRAMTFRFPIPKQDVIFELFAENPQTGIMEKVVSKNISVNQLARFQPANVEIKELALAIEQPALRVNIYADGYLKKDKNVFWKHALKTVKALQNEKFPGVEHMSFYAVYHESNTELGRAKNLGLPVPERDSFLGLYYPYWENFGRWYNIVYPTRENKFRDALATAPYDYPIVLLNNNEYWGVGNYMAFTAIPAASSSNFTYLLLHEFGHFFGLNEEYQGGGRTELEFAPEIDEPWSQNITFLTNPTYDHLKWNTFVDTQIALPTPNSVWRSNPPVYGAYDGGYADSVSTKGTSHRAGLNCVMERYPNFCDICKHGIEEVILYDLGKA